MLEARGVFGCELAGGQRHCNLMSLTGVAHICNARVGQHRFCRRRPHDNSRLLSHLIEQAIRMRSIERADVLIPTAHRLERDSVQ